jgi:hypothetical protein
MTASCQPHLERWHKIVFQRNMQDLQAMLPKMSSSAHRFYGVLITGARPHS